jgi:hypothetical protein
MQYVKLLVLLPVIVFGYQLYRYTITLQREEKQRACKSLGIIIFSVGVACLALRNVPSFILGIVTIMIGFRLIAFGLDRKNKTIFMDRYDDTP